MLKLFLTFLKIGAFTFGGGYAMVPLIQDELVNKQKLLEQEEFIDYLSIAQSYPGVLA
ncbi:chromate transporter, partial [Clostridioides difficile]|nr:chromate transporter [Clostridioides difficile]